MPVQHQPNPARRSRTLSQNIERGSPVRCPKDSGGDDEAPAAFRQVHSLRKSLAVFINSRKTGVAGGAANLDISCQYVMVRTFSETLNPIRFPYSFRNPSRSDRRGMFFIVRIKNIPLRFSK